LKRVVYWLNLLKVVVIFFGAAPFLLGWAPISQSAKNRPAFDWPSIGLVHVTGSLSAPVHLTHAGDGSGRLFIVEQSGRIRIYQSGALLPTPFLNISDRVLSPSNGGGGEEGLLSVAFPPNYTGKGYFYVYYTNLNGNNQISRFHISGANQANANSEELILSLNHPTQNNHNGGQLAFGPDGYLYIGTGDGGGAGDPPNNAQNPNTLLGKILRIDVEPGQPPAITQAHRSYLPLMLQGGPSPLAYRIPSDNPFVGQSGYRQEIWALGLRNPWRFSFDRLNDDLYIADVGQSAWEEVNHQPGSSNGGENYGWRIMEGKHCYNSQSCNQSGLTLPVWEYSHADGCSITGGFVYRGSTYPALQGIYFFADYCSGKIWGLVKETGVWQSSLLLDSPYNVSSFGEDEAGELYVVDRDGNIYRVVLTTVTSR
jgi:glucose/arabinose dehydrogenase